MNMRTVIRTSREREVVTLASEIVYAQRKEWCGTKYRQLAMSLMKPRCHYECDEDQVYPLIVWLCGGSFAEVDRNIWIPELTGFVRNGYAVASVDYSTISLTRYPDQLRDIREAIRFIRAHAKEFHIDPNRIAVMGESAGGYLSALAALAPPLDASEEEGFLEYSSEVQSAVCLYPCVDIKALLPDRKRVNLPEDLEHYDDLCSLVNKTCRVPFLLMHGLSDHLVPPEHSEKLYQALQQNGIRSDLYLLEDADHADRYFVAEETKKIITKFLNESLHVDCHKTAFMNRQ